MTIKVGDKVKIIKKYSSENGKVGIVYGKCDGEFKVMDEEMTIPSYSSFLENELELAEAAHYVPVPKFKVGDMVYDTKTKNKYIILEERENDLRYHCWSYAYDTDVFMLEEELTREEPKEA